MLESGYYIPKQVYVTNLIATSVIQYLQQYIIYLAHNNNNNNNLMTVTVTSPPARERLVSAATTSYLRAAGPDRTSCGLFWTWGKTI